MERVVLDCGVRERGDLFYKVSAGSVFLHGSVKWYSGMQEKICHRAERAGIHVAGQIHVLRYGCLHILALCR